MSRVGGEPLEPSVFAEHEVMRGDALRLASGRHEQGAKLLLGSAP